MSVIAVSAPEGHLWNGRMIHVCGAAAHTILTLNGTFSWCDQGRHWAWICDRSITLIWPEPASAEHAALMAEFADHGLVLRPVKEAEV